MAIRRNSIKSRVRGGSYIKMGAMRQMLVRVEESNPGAGHWALDQVSSDGEFVDAVQNLILDAFYVYKKTQTLKGRP
jgi:hypothetical protein